MIPRLLQPTPGSPGGSFGSTKRARGGRSGRRGKASALLLSAAAGPGPLPAPPPLPCPQSEAGKWNEPRGTRPEAAGPGCQPVPRGKSARVQLPAAGTLGRAAAPGGGRGGAAAPSPSGSRTQPQPAPLGRSAARSPERCHGAEAAPGPGRGGLAAAAALRAAPRRRRHQPRPGRSASGAGAGPGGSAGWGGRWCRSWDRGTGAREARGRAVRCVGPRAGWEAGRAAAPRLLRARALLPAGGPRAPPVGPRAAARAAGLVFRCRAGLRVRGRCRWQLPGLCRGRRDPRVLGAPASREEPLAVPVRTSPGVPVPCPLSCPSLAGRGRG